MIECENCGRDTPQALFEQPHGKQWRAKCNVCHHNHSQGLFAASGLSMFGVTAKIAAGKSPAPSSRSDEMESEITPEKLQAYRHVLLTIARRAESSGWSSHVPLREIADLLPHLMPVDVTKKFSADPRYSPNLTAVRRWTDPRHD